MAYPGPLGVLFGVLYVVAAGEAALPSRSAVLSDAKRANNYFHGIPNPGEAHDNNCIGAKFRW